MSSVNGSTAYVVVLAGGLLGAVGGFVGSTFHKPKPIIVQPQTTVISRPVPMTQTTKQADGSSVSVTASGAGGGPGGLTRAEQRQLAAQWGDLAQPEVDALSAALKSIAKTPMTIFCQDDSKCGDMQLDFDNAFETAHWDTKLEAPLIDDTIGVATSREDLRDAINAATSGRLSVKIIAKNAPYDVLVIGKKSAK